MQQTTKQSARPRARTVAVALGAGFAVLLLLFPGSGIDRQPPECYSMVGYVVPCDAWVAWAAATATAGLVGLALTTNHRRNQHGDGKGADQ
jgi:uncharacterized membrane protein YgaE (UPF0421/DUF939 family)